MNGFTFSGTATESTGFPIVASMNSPASVIKSTPSAADGNIYGGAMSSGSGAATTGRPPQIQRNSQPGPGVRNIDFRVTREVPVHERMHFEFIAEAFNLMNHTIISGTNTAFATQLAPTGGTGACPDGGSAGRIAICGLHCAVRVDDAFRRVRGDDHNQQRPVRAAAVAAFG